MICLYVLATFALKRNCQFGPNRTPYVVKSRQTCYPTFKFTLRQNPAKIHIQNIHITIAAATTASTATTVTTATRTLYFNYTSWLQTVSVWHANQTHWSCLNYHYSASTNWSSKDLFYVITCTGVRWIVQPWLVIYDGQFPQLEKRIVPGSEPATFR